MLEARAVLNAGVGEERVHGSGMTGDPAVELAELLCEVVLTPAGWRLGAAGASMPTRRWPRRLRGRSGGG